MVTSLRAALASGIEHLNADGARLDCQLILGHILNRNRAWLIAHDDEALSLEQQSVYTELVNQRARGKPMAYILGHQEFWSLQFRVCPDVLIPRPETELLVEAVLDHRHQPSLIADLGTGTGAIAIALGLEHAEDTIFAMDYSADALSVAADNRTRLGASNVHLFRGSWLSAMASSSLDTIVSNPPYIANQDTHLPALSFEPLSALVSGSDGLDDIRQLINDAKRCLKSGGLLAMEHGYDQQAEILELLSRAGYRNISGEADLGGQPRIVLAERP